MQKATNDNAILTSYSVVKIQSQRELIVFFTIMIIYNVATMTFNFRSNLRRDIQYYVET